jgi:hypothetical protein
MRRYVVLLIVVALVAVTSMTTWVVAGAGTKGKISGCVDDQTGEIDRMRFGRTPQGGECGEGETAFTWNVRGRRGPTGPQGPPGPQGPAGVGAPGVSGWERVEGVCQAVATANGATLQAICPAGKTLLAGGGAWHATSSCTAGGLNSPDLTLSNSFPFSNTAWRVSGWNATAGTSYLQPFAICAHISP